MIAKLSGRLDSSGEGWAVIDVGGVGYLVFCAGRTLAALPSEGGAVSLQIETVVREDQFNLYGFFDAREREWFRLLRTVQSVGAKMALAILGLLSPDELALAIAARDKATLTRVSGVGPKLAERMLTELKDKAPVGAVPVSVPGAVGESQSNADAVSALVNLGYRQSEAFGVVSDAARRLGDEATLENLIQAGLKELSA
ncbi:MAG: Holliday junction branch migration protein RuvA [Rhodospirillaceae bacterium]|jgi:holliday junction DNA helicase RuvA|nr:Holliday junction branch migration protein RuvA [Rhodospirillaceae bacterium]MBT3629218.1 Holliday junction branch migration protein RuvA [Rhodospirillaceae bacterium]MBT3928091.1 Holliday junction branch migration protein RuvA [Rhodospirillaceae bacterium]MBT4428090.1 Holliday junction branch migration protein RuvA [Rhodospirillaceae bacterium]MBT5039434.1 Holliday junction branch migration protein RuvA [Rhodospirillaceae bacterium]